MIALIPATVEPGMRFPGRFMRLPSRYEDFLFEINTLKWVLALDISAVASFFIHVGRALSVISYID
jgi:hypothetical protein